MIKRSSLKFTNNLLKKNKSWKILDIGCGYTANENATTLCDVIDLQDQYPDKKFVKLVSKNLPFADKEFDFVIASHVIEHVRDVKTFLSELERVSSKGYIELPTILEDNLVFENKNDHIWHTEFDDDEKKINISSKLQYIEPILTVSSSKNFMKVFRQSLILELYWENSIEYNLNQKMHDEVYKISRLILLRKFISKIFRNFLRKN